MIEVAFSDGTDATICAMEPMFALQSYIESHADKYPLLAETDLFNGVVESEEFDSILQELQSINCEGNCPAIQNLIEAFQSALDNNDEWVMFN